MNTKEKLQLALGYIQQGHTKGAYARDQYGCIVSVHSRVATCWCVTGALRKACGADTSTGDSAWRTLMSAINLIYLKYTYDCIATFNDDPETQLVDIEKVFSVAIALA